MSGRVLIATAITSLLLSPALAQQSGLKRTVIRNHRVSSRLFHSHRRG